MTGAGDARREQVDIIYLQMRVCPHVHMLAHPRLCREERRPGPGAGCRPVRSVPRLADASAEGSRA